MAVAAAAVAFAALALAMRARRTTTAAPIEEPPPAATFSTTFFKDAALAPPASSSSTPIAKAAKFKHAVVENAIPAAELASVFATGVLPCYREMQLPAYSRYESWTQSCYMEIDPRWTPRPEINLPLFDSMRQVQEQCRQVFAKWYCDLYSLDSVEVTTLNSFVTKYVPSEGKNEFGKHIDGVKVHGSLVLALPTDEPHDWPGILVWDGPKGRGPVGKDPRPEHQYVLQPGDALVMDRMVWHHGLPITKGHRYVVVNFYSVAWKFVKKQPKAGEAS